ncbi:FG-GAP repeat protein [Streptomyces niveus]
MAQRARRLGSSASTSWRCAAGDLNGDGYTDLAVGRPSTTESGHILKGGDVNLDGYDGILTNLPG